MKRKDKIPRFGQYGRSFSGREYSGLYFPDLCRLEVSTNIFMYKPVFDMLLSAARRKHPDRI